MAERSVSRREIALAVAWFVEIPEVFEAVMEAYRIAKRKMAEMRDADL